ncbi:MAG TPA: hypothetical protein VGK19_05075 [Capsulimonadaceae bacterium]|jgi:hypothetical protein
MGTATLLPNVLLANANGSTPPPADPAREELVDYIKLRLAVAGWEFADDDYRKHTTLPREVISHLKERIRLSYGKRSPIEKRAQAFLDRYLADVPDIPPVRLPGLGQTYILDRSGMAEELSLPADGDNFMSDIVSSYRLTNGQGVLHNPKSDRRTTEGVFHVTEGGAPVPNDKKAVPKAVFARMLNAALTPPPSILELPFTSSQLHPFRSLVTLMLRPMVVPQVDGITPQKSAEIQFIAPGNLVSNLDFIERIFGNAGDPHLPENDAGLDVEHWTGQTGMVILAPHLITLTKEELGLPHIDNATERQKRDGMCWTEINEIYNGGNAFKLTCRNDEGVIVTIIADNYFGYCKKEVKTQISYCANLLGGVEEEHSGGALVFPRYDLGKEFTVPTHLPKTDHTFAKVVAMFGDTMDVMPEGYAVDRSYPEIVYVPEDVRIDVTTQTVSWTTECGPKSLPLAPGKLYIVPSGFKVSLEYEAESAQWRLIGTRAEGTFCHKPSTVSGGGKSEISKPITDAITHAPFFVANFESDMDHVQRLLDHDYSHRFRHGRTEVSRPILSPQRSLGSVIKLLTPSETLYTDEYNKWLLSIPHSIRELVFAVKRYYRPEMGDDWRSDFSVNVVNGRPSNTLKFAHEPLIARYMRVGFALDGSWRMFSLRNDYAPAEKLQREDDITVSMVIPNTKLPGLNPRYVGPVSSKLVSPRNPESRLFQRPDDAVHRGYDKATEAHFARKSNFFSNYEPLTEIDAAAILAKPIEFAQFTEPMRDVIRNAAANRGYFVSSAHPRIVDGKPTKNPRYLQIPSELDDSRPDYIAQIGARLHRNIPESGALHRPVNAVLPGRRLNPPDAKAGIRSLACYNPIHYQETPELFMELISSLTGKSPSTTGAGSEGALTKGPFNALLPIIDLNAAFVSHVLTGTRCFVTAAGYVGPKFRVDHDISLLIPEIWSRMDVEQRSPAYLIENQFLEKIEDFEADGRVVLASRLGYRITNHFVRTFFGIVFDNPNDLFTDEMLRPELQDPESFNDAIDNIVGTQKSIAEHYFADGGIELACPPLRVLLHIMRDGHYEGKSIHDPEIRKMFSASAVLESGWYRARLEAQSAGDVRLWSRHVEYLDAALDNANKASWELKSRAKAGLRTAKAMLETVKAEGYTESLIGYIGATPSS